MWTCAAGVICQAHDIHSGHDMACTCATDRRPQPSCSNKCSTSLLCGVGAGSRRALRFRPMMASCSRLNLSTKTIILTSLQTLPASCGRTCRNESHIDGPHTLLPQGCASSSRLGRLHPRLSAHPESSQKAPVRAHKRDLPKYAHSSALASFKCSSKLFRACATSWSLVVTLASVSVLPSAMRRQDRIALKAAWPCCKAMYSSARESRTVSTMLEGSG